MALDLCRDLGINCMEVAPVSDPGGHRDLMFVDDENNIYVLYCTRGISITNYQSPDSLNVLAKSE
jgi:hypothetical protein